MNIIQYIKQKRFLRETADQLLVMVLEQKLVEPVFCINCKHFIEGNNKLKMCEYNKFYMGEDGYCSLGES